MIVLAVLVLSFLLTWILIRTGGLRLDTPNERSSHVQVVPRGGGAAFVIAIVLGVAASIIFGVPETPINPTAPGRLEMARLVAIFVAIAAIGGIEDVKNLPASARLGAEVLLAYLAVRLGLRWQAFDLGFVSVDLPTWVGSIITVLWIVWIVNLYNFMDGINGIAAVTGIVLFCILGQLCAFAFGFGPAHFALITAAALVGFLPFNFPSAKIFMGDVGSLALGFSAAVLPLYLHRLIPGYSLIWGVLTIAPFFMDATLTLGIRAARRENITRAHREHFYQKLTDLCGGRHVLPSCIYAGWQLLFALIATMGFADKFSNGTLIYGLGALLALFGFFGGIQFLFSRRRQPGSV